MSKKNERGDWEELENASYCTMIPATAPKALIKRAAEHICKEYVANIHEHGEAGPSKKLGEGLSYLSDKDFKQKKVNRDER